MPRQKDSAKSEKLEKAGSGWERQRGKREVEKHYVNLTTLELPGGITSYAGG